MADLIDRITNEVWSEVADSRDSKWTLRREHIENAVKKALAALEPASGGVGEPVAWMRRWAFDGNEGTRGNRPPGWALHAVTQSKLMETDVPLYTTPALWRLTVWRRW